MLLMTAGIMALDVPGIDLKVGKNVYKNNSSISRKWNGCLGGGGNPTLIFWGLCT